MLLRSAVGKTHDLRSDLGWTIPLRILLDHFGIPFGSQSIKSALARHSGVQVPVVSRHEGHVVILDQSQRSLLVPSISYLRVYMGCALAFVLQVTFPVTWSTFKGPFRGVPSR